MKTQNFVAAIRGKRLHEANQVFTQIMRDKVASRLAEERKSVTLAEDEKRCEACGSTKNLRTAEDGTVLCGECDIDDMTETHDPARGGYAKAKGNRNAASYKK